MNYLENFNNIEKAMQRFWKSDGVDYADLADGQGEKLYVLGMFPYPSGNAHLGHIMVYSITDILARLGRFKGKTVINPIGWDSFGLPAENAAIKNNVHPAEWTRRNIEKMRGPQIGRAGFSFDLTKEIDTSSPEFYRWTQWLFLKLHEHGQAYRAKAWVNWDPVDKTVLANEQVIDGRGWRSGAPIERREMEQWNFRITSFAEELWQGLDDLTGWSERAIAAQRNWIGRSEGCEIDFPVVGSEHVIKAFTTRPDTVYGVTSVTLAPDHPLVTELTAPERRVEVAKYVAASILKSEVERQADEEKSGVDIGCMVRNPLSGQAVPVFVSDYVLASYGTGAIMNVPAHDERDYAFARSKALPIKTVIEPENGKMPEGEAFTGDGIMVNSDRFTGLPSGEARTRIADFVEQNGLGERVVRYRLRDWSVSRQRFWGAPIPMLRRQDGSWEPVPVDDLPVRLPTDVDFEVAAGKSPLGQDPAFYETLSPTDGTPCTREVDTMDTFMCSAWYAWRFLDPTNERLPVAPELADRWMPIDYYVGGLEHANQHLIYFRYISHFLHSIGFTKVREPVKTFLDNGMIQKNGFKMSKSRGNVVRPDEMIAQYGADALRLYVLSDTPYSRDREWDDTGLVSKQRFLGSIWSFYTGAGDRLDLAVERNAPPAKDSWSVKLLADLFEMTREVEQQVEDRHAFHVAVARIHSFANTMREAAGEASGPERARVLSYVMQNYLKVLGLLCPHIADRLWQDIFGQQTSLFREAWPTVDDEVIRRARSEVRIAVSVDGKRRKEIAVSADIEDDDLKRLVSGDSDLDRYLSERSIARVILVRGPGNEPKLVNVVTADIAE